MPLKHFLIILLVLVSFRSRAASPQETETAIKNWLLENNACLVSQIPQRPSPLLHFIKKQQKKNKKLTAAVLAFPFPFGMVGLHRIYMGTAPYVPVVYIATLGGVFGILPFIDFCVILIEKDTERFDNNPKVFMWVN